MKKNDYVILEQVREDARMKLTVMSKRTGIPVSTIHDRLKAGVDGAITKMVALLDFRLLGYTVRATIILKVDRGDRESVRAFLSASKQVNNLYKINNGFDFMIDGVFQYLQDLEKFVEELEDQFSIKDKQVYYVIEEVVREKFMGEGL